MSFENYPAELKIVPKTSVPVSAYPELAEFLDAIEKQEQFQINQQPYYVQKETIKRYKIIFLLFGALFFFLGFIVSMKKPHWISQHIIIDTFFVQYCVIAFSWVLSTFSIYFGTTLKVEKEVAHSIAKKAKKAIATKFSRQRLDLSTSYVLPFGAESRKHGWLKQRYWDAVDAIRHTKEEYVLLLDRIAKTQFVSEEIKEKLFNQTLLKFRDHAQEIVQTFEG